MAFGAPSITFRAPSMEHVSPIDHLTNAIDGFPSPIDGAPKAIDGTQRAIDGAGEPCGRDSKLHRWRSEGDRPPADPAMPSDGGQGPSPTRRRCVFPHGAGL